MHYNWRNRRLHAFFKRGEYDIRSENAMVTHTQLSVVFILLYSAAANAELGKKNAGLNEWTENQSNCYNDLCMKLGSGMEIGSLFTEKIDKSDRKRKTDKFSEFNSDNGSDTDARNTMFGFSYTFDE